MSKIVCYGCGYRSEDEDDFTVIPSYKLQWDTMEPIILCNECVDESETLSDRSSNRES